MKRTVILSVTSDLVTDQRVHKVAETLSNNNYKVVLVGRKLHSSLPMDERRYKTKRFKLWFSKGALFYANYNIRLFFYLLFHKLDILLANDLDTLAANYLVSRLRNKPLVYDSHEYFTGVPELQHRQRVRKIWEKIEGYIFPKLNYVYTVNDSIAGLYAELYRKEIKVVKNVPVFNETPMPKRFPAEKKILIYQGSGINVNRGAEELLLAMSYLDVNNYVLWIVGGGDVFDQLKKLAASKNLEEKVKFISKVPFNQLQQITMQADLGLSFDKPTNLNYLYSLPNKVFDYLHAGLPILTTRLPEIARLNQEYEVGNFIENHDPQHIAERISFMFSDMERYQLWKKNTLLAAQAYCWQKEEETIIGIFRQIEASL